MINLYFDPEPLFEERAKTLAEIWQPILMIQQKHYVTDGLTNELSGRLTEAHKKIGLSFFKRISNFKIIIKLV